MDGERPVLQCDLRVEVPALGEPCGAVELVALLAEHVPERPVQVGAQHRYETASVTASTTTATAPR